MEELEKGIVFRLATIKDTFPPDSPRLHVAHLELSERDKERDPPLLSVFDGGRTTVRQAEVIRGVDAESAAFGFYVETIRSLRIAGLRSLRVVRDPLEPPASALPGADGHCGIEGLHRAPGDEKRLYRELRVRLADESFRYLDWMSGS
jgi:hypothetical protein